ncbi:hypothetical protein B9Z19DRAFT_1137469 [Tuber borchii]|uniref:Uncharacterized protein n=1 Tax=Tuber borchii TaxID=42251 RepID=A0A2T6ZAJ0_TUBBO|nr:hypothetical protein B9Z19DRAFT_1137469 [Tuber borchii]
MAVVPVDTGESMRGVGKSYTEELGVPSRKWRRVGKYTASVVDPSGRISEGDAAASERLDEPFDGLWFQIEKFFEKCGEYAISKGYNEENFGKSELKTNADWFDALGLAEFLPAVSQHIRVSSMLAPERLVNCPPMWHFLFPRISIYSVKKMNFGNGINFPEFPYQLPRSSDFWHKYRTANCRLLVPLGFKRGWRVITIS